MDYNCYGAGTVHVARLVNQIEQIGVIIWMMYFRDNSNNLQSRELCNDIDCTEIPRF